MRALVRIKGLGKGGMKCSCCKVPKRYANRYARRKLNAELKLEVIWIVR